MFDFAALAMAVVISAYWGRVLRMAYKLRRKQSKANMIPRETVGRWTRLVWYPVVVAWIALPWLAGLKVQAGGVLVPLWAQPIWLSWIWVGVAAMALGGSYVCWRAMASNWRMGIDPNEKTELVIKGPFKYVRHPIYSLSILLMMSTMLVTPSPAMLGVGVLHWGLLVFEALREEQHLKQLHGAVYSHYSDRVGAFVPRFDVLLGRGADHNQEKT